jgi:hypothetical protein
VARENDVVATERALGREHMECDTEHDRVKGVHQDHRARLCASTAGQRHSIDFDRVLSGRQFTLFVRETKLER